MNKWKKTLGKVKTHKLSFALDDLGLEDLDMVTVDLGLMSRAEAIRYLIRTEAKRKESKT